MGITEPAADLQSWSKPCQMWPATFAQRGLPGWELAGLLGPGWGQSTACTSQHLNDQCKAGPSLNRLVQLLDRDALFASCSVQMLHSKGRAMGR